MNNRRQGRSSDKYSIVMIVCCATSSRWMRVDVNSFIEKRNLWRLWWRLWRWDANAVRFADDGANKCMVLNIESTANAWREQRKSTKKLLYSNFLRLPFGAGSRGVRVYVTVLVTTWRTLTERWQPDRGVRGDSCIRALLSRYQSAGEKGERMALLWGESVGGE